MSQSKFTTQDCDALVIAFIELRGLNPASGKGKHLFGLLKGSESVDEIVCRIGTYNDMLLSLANGCQEILNSKKEKP